jgi:hypothetical protein
MIATSVALTVWTAGLAYIVRRNKDRQILEDRDVEGDTPRGSAGPKSKGVDT